MSDSLGDRMKRYESVTDFRMAIRTPVIARLDGKAFHTFSKGLTKPFDARLNACFMAACKALSKTEGFTLGYHQSDEISLLFTDWETFNTQATFNYRVQKLSSVLASVCTAAFVRASLTELPFSHHEKPVAFDCRVFNLPIVEVQNYFVWRQQDAERNSIQGYGQSMFSHKELQGVSCGKLLEKMETERAFSWQSLPTVNKRGTLFIRDEIIDTPIFAKERHVIEDLIPEMFHKEFNK